MSASAPPMRRATRCSSSASRAAPTRRGRSTGWSPRRGSSRRAGRGRGARRLEPLPRRAGRAQRAARRQRGGTRPPSPRTDGWSAAGRVRVSPPIEAVAVFDTVGSYGIPAGFGLAALARLWTWWRLALPRHRAWRKRARMGLHAIAVDEHRRPFSPTFWTRRKAAPAPAPSRIVEQTWFAGSHGNVGGRKSQLAARQSGAGVDGGAAAGADRPRPRRRGDGGGRRRRNSGGAGVVNSTIGWWPDQRWPRLRAMLSPDAFDPGISTTTTIPAARTSTSACTGACWRRPPTPPTRRAICRRTWRLPASRR